MVDKVIGVFTTALVVTALGIALRPGSSAPKLVDSILGGFAKVQRASYAA